MGLIMRTKNCALVILFLLVIVSSVLAKSPVPRAFEPAECTNLEDCNRLWRTGEAFECSDGKCKCHPQAKFDEENKDCKCNPGYQKSSNNCFAQPAFPQNVTTFADSATRTLKNCKNDSECFPNAICLNTRCECNTSYVMVSSTCMLAATTVGEQCQYDEVCQENLGGYSKCENTRCVCMTHAIPAVGNTTCHLKKGLGESCITEEQCSHVLHGKCNFDICACETGFVSFNGSCIRVVDQYNAICNHSAQCQEGKLGYGSMCKRSEVDTLTCLCEVEFFYKQDLKMCIYAKGLGEQCDEKNTGCYLPADGTTQNVQCKSGTCVCKKKYIASEDNRQCVSAGLANHARIIVMVLSLFLCSTRW